MHPSPQKSWMRFSDGAMKQQKRRHRPDEREVRELRAMRARMHEVEVVQRQEEERDSSVLQFTLMANAR